MAIEIQRPLTTADSGYPLFDVDNTGNSSLRRLEENPWDGIFGGEGVPDDLVHAYEGLHEIVRQMEDLKKIFPGQKLRLLDVGTGAGRHLPMFIDLGFEASGFDLSSQGLAIAQNVLAEQGLAASLALADMFETYPYADDTFECSVAIQSIYHGYEHEFDRAISEMARVTKRGGLLGITISYDKMRSTMGASEEGESVRMINNDPRVLMPLKGREKGLVHFYPGLDDIMVKLQRFCKNVNIRWDEEHRYYVVTAFKK